MALSVISLLRGDSVAFECEADMRTVDRSNQSDVNDPTRTLAEAAVHRRGSHCRNIGVLADPDSERFRSAPRTCLCFRDKLRTMVMETP
jgi:hypothetical protein